MENRIQDDLWNEKWMKAICEWRITSGEFKWQTSFKLVCNKYVKTLKTADSVSEQTILKICNLFNAKNVL